MRTGSGLARFAAALAGLAVLAAAEADGTTWTRVTHDFGGGSPDSNCVEPAVSANGRFVAFHSNASDLLESSVEGWTQVYVRDRQAGVTELVSRTPAGGIGNQQSTTASISASGRFVAFLSRATDLVASPGSVPQVYVADRKTGTLIHASVTPGGVGVGSPCDLYGSVLSANGRFVVFSTAAGDVVPGVATHTYAQVYRRDLVTGTTMLVSRDRDDATSGATGTCSRPTISPSGRFVAFSCNAANLVPGDSNGQMHLYLYDTKRGTMARVSQREDGTLGNGMSYEATISKNGQRVAFASAASNLADGDANNADDVFLADRKTGELRRVSAGAALGKGSYSPSIAANGKFVVFHSEAEDLVAVDGNAAGDTFRHDVASGAVTLLSVDPQGAAGNGTTYMYGPSLSSNAKWLVVTTAASTLAGPQQEVEANYDVYVRRME